MRILLVEDDTDLCRALLPRLAEAGYEAEVCHSGEDGLALARTGAHDILVLDRLLPELDGVALLKKLRAEGCSVPVLFITALDGVGDRVDGLDAGADDYLTKPFAVEELLARLRALARRPRDWACGPLLQFADLTLDPRQRLLSCGGQAQVLAKRESDLLALFLQAPGRILPRERLLAGVWGSDAVVEEGNLDTYVHFLRRRLHALNSRAFLETIRAAGYRLGENRG